MLTKLKDKIWLQIFVIYTRYLIGGTFVFASLIKIKGTRFTLESGAENPINSAWHFFETLYQSGLYWKFIGIAQLLAGFLLMTQRYAKLGAIANFPIILNIFIITLSYYFAFTPVITGGMLLANIMLLLWDWNELKVLFNLKPTYTNHPRLERDKTWEITGLLLFLFTFGYRAFVDKYQIFFWFGTCLLIGLIGFIIGLRRRKILQPK
ncbi:hypothetical protein H2O64_08410 [Kordia sp. YSTF-M3]|uniref:DoxX family membrane protein n=1 Tax=Kordia aestuariivivens TaxID=2759037 RepID=A0ABR7Q800_9FLAO|nr:hypothetical protein [Kordia aestuariivivens]MBC8754690.1 hypothetical protein [Kordia aestuariivivens]